MEWYFLNVGEGGDSIGFNGQWKYPLKIKIKMLRKCIASKPALHLTNVKWIFSAWKKMIPNESSGLCKTMKNRENDKYISKNKCFSHLKNSSKR